MCAIDGSGCDIISELRGGDECICTSHVLLRPLAPPILSSTPLPPLSELPAGSAGVRNVDPSVAAFDSSSEPTDAAGSL